jgi:hypothetical protein
MLQGLWGAVFGNRMYWAIQSPTLPAPMRCARKLRCVANSIEIPEGVFFEKSFPSGPPTADPTAPMNASGAHRPSTSGFFLDIAVLLE